MVSMQFEYKTQPNVESTSNNRMSPKAIVFFALLAAAFAGPPRVGLRIPFLPQVVGGSDAPKAGYPFIVSLQVNGASHFCAGSILSEKWVVTAGHCILAVPSPRNIVVKAGKHSIRSNEDTEQVVNVNKAFVHEQYAGGVAPYDIGLLELASPLKFTREVQPIELSPHESDPEGDAVLCGWGSVSKSWIPDMPDKLQHVDLRYMDRRACHEAVERLTGSSPVHETNVCTIGEGISACSGDSGGPLISRNGQKPVLTGIVSWGIIPCATSGAPSVYTRVSKFNPWIKEKTGQ